MRSIPLIIVLMLLTASSSLLSDDKGAVSIESPIAEHQLSPALDSLIRTYIGEISADSIGSYIEQLVNFKTRFMLSENRRQIATWIGTKFQSFGYTNVIIDSFQNTIEYPFRSGQQHSTWQYNVSTSITGRKNPSDTYVLGAHYDCMITEPGSDPF